MSDLLAYIARNSHVAYISDLSLTPLSRQVIESIDAELFPLFEWIGAVDYLCKSKIVFTNVQEAKQYLLTQFDNIR